MLPNLMDFQVVRAISILLILLKILLKDGKSQKLFRDSRVCTFSRPYYLGPGSVRKHPVPLGSIPCLKYLKDLDDEAKEAERQKAAESATVATETEPARCPVAGPLAAALHLNKDMDGSKFRLFLIGNIKLKPVAIIRCFFF